MSQNNYAINTNEYWEERFASSDWNQYGGNFQSAFFSELAVTLFPTWLKNELQQNKWTVGDFGCAEGGGTALLADHFPSCSFTGLDFSESAIRTAKERYFHCNFFKCDFMNESIKSFDVVFSSNTLEHLASPFEAQLKLCQAAKKYAIFLLPYEDNTGILEHISRFDENSFPMVVDNFFLNYFRIFDCEACNSPYWKEKQILLVYANLEYKSINDVTVGQYYHSYQTESMAEKALKDREHLLEQTKRDLEICVRENQKYALENSKLTHDMNQILDANRQVFPQLRYDNMLKTKQLDIMTTAVMSVKEKSMSLMDSKLYKVYHFMFRVKNQLIAGNMLDKKKFFKWLKNAKGNSDTHYNLARSIYNELNSCGLNEADPLENSNAGTLFERYRKCDVIVLSIISYDFRYQRPQQMADRYAENGHRVFYVNSIFNEYGVNEVKKNIFSTNFSNENYKYIYECDWLNESEMFYNNIQRLIRKQMIFDAIVIVDFPNWYPVAMHLRETYGFKFVTDYMDDFTGFSNTGSDLIRENCIALLKESSAVIASSAFLYDQASKYNKNTHLIRNGTDYNFFSHADVQLDNERKIVGYYGAVAEWFDAAKVCFLAKHLPDTDIVIIGEVTLENEISKQMKAFTNIKFLGEKPYAELPEYLKDFDVCIIPFDTSSELIKATNPVKFYEYLSAGKKIVATEIPELQAYKNEYVYLANDDRKFLDYVKMCLEGTDNLKSIEERREIGKNNDWNNRFIDFKKVCDSVPPKVSIIVLTYNGLELNKICISSILSNTAYSNFELILVDNASSDGTVEYLSDLRNRNYPNVKIVLNEENFGFAKGNNIGISVATGDYIVLLNNDTFVARGWLTSLIKHLENDPRMGMSGAVTNVIGNEAKIQVQYNSIEQLFVFAEKYCREHTNESYSDISVLAMFCTAIKKEVIEKCGVLDEKYTIGMFEDDDYSERVKQAGYKICVAEDAFVHHFGSASFSKIDQNEFNVLFNNNKKLYMEKFGHDWIPHKYRDGVEGPTNFGMTIDISKALLDMKLLGWEV